MPEPEGTDGRGNTRCSNPACPLYLLLRSTRVPLLKCPNQFPKTAPICAYRLAFFTLLVVEKAGLERDNVPQGG